ncbi:OmpA family protein [compost metagenome]
MVGGASEPAPAASAPAVAVAPAADSGPAPVINFGPMSLVNGKIDFTDLFVKPNYSADLSELTGKLSSFSSNPPNGQGGRPALADLELRGKAQQTAALEITGKLNPLAKPLELDITAKMRDLDLAPLSPYSVRYAGHGIERGKMSMDVNYKIAPDGQLTATNKLVLNQLKFGDEVAGAPNSLPVRLAVTLLADRNGVIDVDLPLRGSLNDPQFSIGPLIFKAVVNLIVKAVTAPFSLLTGGLGGGGSGDSSAITFEPGSSTLSSGAKESLDKVVKALTERPTLQMTVVGTSSLEKERDAYQRQRLRQLTQAEKRRVAVRGGQTGTEVAPVTDAEYPELLTAVYKRSDITKPRNMVGLAKDLPVKEMENLLLASVPVDEESMRQLAVERGAVVRDYLLAQKLPSERLFLGAVRTTASGNDWKPGAELSLTMK